jgi:hypothetical protein
MAVLVEGANSKSAAKPTNSRQLVEFVPFSEKLRTMLRKSLRLIVESSETFPKEFIPLAVCYRARFDV